MSLETVNLCKIFEKKHQIHYYDSLSPADRIKAWGSFTTWIKNPVANMGPGRSLVSRLFVDLINSKYFCPLADKDVILRMLKPVKDRNAGECYLMLRLSQNTRPLVWVCAIGGSTQIIRVRIGVNTIPATTTTTPALTNYTVILNQQLAYQDTNLQRIVGALCEHYVKGKTIRAWTQAVNQFIVVGPADSSSAQNQTMILV